MRAQAGPSTWLAVAALLQVSFHEARAEKGLASKGFFLGVPAANASSSEGGAQGILMSAAAIHGDDGRDSLVWIRLLLVPVFLGAATTDGVPKFITLSCWMAVGILMNIVNKMAASRFDAPLLLVILQMIFACFWLLLVEGKRLQSGSPRDLARWLVVPFIFGAMLVTSLLSFRQCSLSTVLVCRNMLPIFTFVIEGWLPWLKKDKTKAALPQILMTLVGVLLYSFGAKTSGEGTTWALTLVFVNSFLSGIDRLIQCHLLKEPNFTMSMPFCLLLNNFLGIPSVLAVALCNGETKMWSTVVRSTSSSTWTWVILSCCCGFSLGYLGLRTQQIISATSSLMLQNFTKVLLVCVGVFFFGDKMDAMMVLGCTVALTGGAWYSYSQLPSETASGKAVKVSK
eukprot:TRINITY_DN14171_c0_g1_i3.p1 TRINITY_DN14171_c0_g1~~TRINITY_DN14171_c0_g1_i3.p1  ORF type:complete len:398 (+),score=48.40 TRINITY_DN14171_c0_g1_i3:69-1262(+)